MRFKNFLLFALLGLLLGCQGTSENEMKEKSELKLNISASPPSFNPFFGIDLYCRSLQKAIFEGLMRIGPSGRSELALAKELTISASKKIYTFTLRDSTFSNGEKVTAYHFEESWKEALHPDSACLRPDLFYPIKNAKLAKSGEIALDEVGVRALDENRLQIELEHPSPYFLDLLAHPLYSPLYDPKGEPKAFNGPFQIKKFTPDKEIILEKNLKYWDSERVNLDEIVFTMIKDPNTALLMYEKGDLDWIGGLFTLLPVDAIAKFSKEGKILQKPTNGVFWLCLNTQCRPLNHPKIRKALSYALDRESIAIDVLEGEIPTSHLIPPNLSKNQNKEFPYDPELAVKLFNEGLSELQLTLEELPPLILSHSDVAGQKKLSESIAEKWERTLGIQVELQGCEWNVFFSNLLSGQYQVGGCNWFSLYLDPIYNLDFFKEPHSRYNTPRWSNDKYRDLLNLADIEIDEDKRAEYLTEAEEILLDEMPIIPIFVINYRYLIRDNFKGLYFSDLGDIDFKWAYLEKN